MITFEEIPWDCLVRLRIDSEIVVSQTRMQTACTGCDFDDLLVIERRKGYVDRVVSAREITIQNLADEGPCRLCGTAGRRWSRRTGFDSKGLVSMRGECDCRQTAKTNS